MKHARDETIRDFYDAVNMSADEIEAWLRTEESRSVGWHHEGENESVGHQSGRRIAELLRTDSRDYDEDDLAHMRKVIGYVHRHMAQGPGGEVEHSRWRYSLMNWGHDPLA
jgi:hypothetical protein